MPKRQVRPLRPEDLESVVAIDGALSGRSRRAYFARRLEAARQDGNRHLQLAVEEGGALAGFMLGRVLEGEFGRSEPGARLEAFGVAQGAQGRGLGRALAATFEQDPPPRCGASIRCSPSSTARDSASRRCTSLSGPCARAARAPTMRRRAMRSS
jgi:ribosomal protein S18 acetylase RimI-like enzyme